MPVPSLVSLTSSYWKMCQQLRRPYSSCSACDGSSWSQQTCTLVSYKVSSGMEIACVNLARLGRVWEWTRKILYCWRHPAEFRAMYLIGCFSVLNFRALLSTNKRHCRATLLVWFCRRDSPATSLPEDFRDYTLAIDCVQFQIGIFTKREVQTAGY